MDGPAITTSRLHLAATNVVGPEGRHERRAKRKATVGPAGVGATVLGREPVTGPPDIGVEALPLAPTDTAVAPGDAQAVPSGARVPDPSTEGPTPLRP